MHSVNLRFFYHMLHMFICFIVLHVLAKRELNYVKIILSRLCKELLLLPFGLAETSGVQNIVQCFSSYVKWLSEFPVPKEQDMASFTVLLKQILQAG